MNSSKQMTAVHICAIEERLQNIFLSLPLSVLKLAIKTKFYYACGYYPEIVMVYSAT